MQRYEIMYLVSPKIKDEDLSPLVEQIRTLIAKQKGKIVEEEEWGKKKLAYPINHFRHGFYYVIYVDLNPEKIADLEKDLKLSDDILRYLIIKHDKQTWQAIQDQKKRAATRAAEGTDDEDETGEEKKEEAAKNVKTGLDLSKAKGKAGSAFAKTCLHPSGHKRKQAPADTLDLSEGEKKKAEEPVTKSKVAKKSKAKKEKENAKKARKDEAKKEKAKLDELDKKLDEILDEDIIE